MQEKNLGKAIEGLMAPCKLEGVVVTLDDDTKDGCCDCPTDHCLVNSRNIAIQKTPKFELQLEK